MKKKKNRVKKQNSEKPEKEGPVKKKKSILQKLNGPTESEKLIPRSLEEKNAGQRLIVVLEKAFLELVHLKSKVELLNVDNHKNLLVKNNRALEEARPDIAHQCLMALLDSPLNKAGKLAIYLHTANNTLIEISPAIRIPRTYTRFGGLIAELLQRHKIKAAQGNQTLMKVISNPVTKYLPVGGKRVGFSVAGKSVNLRDYIAETFRESQSPTFVPPVFVIGSVAFCDPVQEAAFGGDYVDESISISPWGLSAACCCAKLTHEFEQLWGV